MPSMEEVQRQLQELHVSDHRRKLMRKEIEELPNILKDNEKILRLMGGTYQTFTGMFIATNSRFLFIDKGYKGKLTLYEFKYDELLDMKYNLGWVYGKIDMLYLGKWIKLEMLEKEETESFFHFIDDQRGSFSSSIDDSTVAEIKIEKEMNPQSHRKSGLFYEVSDLQIEERPEVKEKVSRWLGFKPLDPSQEQYIKKLKKRYFWRVFLAALILAVIVISLIVQSSLIEVWNFAVFLSVLWIGGAWVLQKELNEDINKKKSTSSLVIYKYCIRYWNSFFEYLIPNSGYRIKPNVTGMFLKYGFENRRNIKITRFFHFPKLQKDRIYYISYKMKKHTETTKRMGLYFELTLPKETRQSLKSFLLVPKGNKLKSEKYTLQQSLVAHNLYTEKAIPQEQLDEIISFLQPLINRDIGVAVKFHHHLEIYLPYFLETKEQLKSEEQIQQIIDGIHLWYAFYERSIIWRYGQFPAEWKEGEEQALEY
ncbi:PH domain-containing protein [Cytobacillus gottheilii]|uniref:PH domain-containing protein n=1 Tax=Cytobacillus gottheilii TaxID=859144 RepID=UPI003CEC4BC4